MEKIQNIVIKLTIEIPGKIIDRALRIGKVQTLQSRGDEISNLYSSKSSGPNSASIYILKVLGLYISNALATLINQSVSKGISCLKLNENS